MIRHIVILHFQKKPVDYMDLLEQTRPLLKEIPGITQYSLYANESKYVPEKVVLKK